MAHIKESHEEVVVDQDGVVQSHVSKRTVAYEPEPPYVKLYLDTVLFLKDLPRGHNAILEQFLRHMSYADQDDGQVIYVNAALKRRIAKTLDVSVSRIDNVLTDLVKGQLFKRLDRGMYQVNPYIFGKGDWQDISELRLTVTFDANGKTIMGEILKTNEAAATAKAPTVGRFPQPAEEGETA